MVDGKYGLGIVGFGGMGSQHGRMLEDNQKIRVVSVCDLKADRLEAGRELGYKTYEAFEDILQDAEVDIILLATPNHLHKDMAIDAFEAGKHVICEKPVTLNADEMRDIIAATERTGRKFMVHQNRRWDNDYLTVKKIFDEQLIGDVFNVESRIHGSRGIPGDWRHVKAYGGGMMLDWGVHLIDRIIMMFNEKLSKLYCEFSYVWKDECDDGFKLLLTFESGKTALIEVGTLNYQSLPHWYVCGTEGTASIRGWNLEGEMMRLESFEEKDAKPIVAGAGFTKTMAPRGEDSVVKLPLPIVESDVREFYANFIDVIEGHAEPFIKNEEVLHIMEIIDAAFVSAETGEVIKF
ncbi:dehydrogenase [Paenibacillus selenitireducens]|uniref:Dehydrogenase n=1 Tax=Paenibacillus selenitireducens TaxID=1324314 RepID=A0A1T2X6T6_9BACL|nr:Gfo/Idh/MocA family oxidoreductase [Paenibacillus selenitireducens]OPA75601.1 dehydrogenase [Paenibacillus selenitireducens]